MLIAKMVAVASINNGIEALSKAIDKREFTPEQLTALKHNIKGLSKNQKAMGSMFDFEFKHGIQWYDHSYKSGEMSYFYLCDFIQQNATHNMAYQLTVPLRKMAELEAQSFQKFIDSEDFSTVFKQPFKWSPRSLYNPSGKFVESENRN